MGFWAKYRWWTLAWPAALIGIALLKPPDWASWTSRGFAFPWPARAALTLAIGSKILIGALLLGAACIPLAPRFRRLTAFTAASVIVALSAQLLLIEITRRHETALHLALFRVEPQRTGTTHLGDGISSAPFDLRLDFTKLSYPGGYDYSDYSRYDAQDLQIIILKYEQKIIGDEAINLGRTKKRPVDMDSYIPPSFPLAAHEYFFFDKSDKPPWPAGYVPDRHLPLAWCYPMPIGVFCISLGLFLAALIYARFRGETWCRFEG